MVIVYCEMCGRRISDEELKSGNARQINENQYNCAQCSQASKRPSVKVAAVPHETVSAQGAPHSESARQPRSARATSRLPRGPGDPPETHKPANSSPTLLLGISAGVLVGIVALFLLTRGSSGPVAQAQKPAPPPTPSPAPQIVPVAPPPAPPAPVATPQPAPEKVKPPPMQRDDGMDDIRNGVATRKLEEAKSGFNANPADPWTYKDRLTELATTYRSTPAGQEAAKLLAELKVGERPAPVAVTAPVDTGTPPPEGSGEWISVFDGKSLDLLHPSVKKSWKIENGALLRMQNESGQSATDLPADLEVRYRFEAPGVEYFYLSMRQGAGGSASVAFDRPQCEKLGNGAHELILRGLGEAVSATLDGKNHPLTEKGPASAGKLHFNGKGLRILAIDYRKISAPPPTPIATPTPAATGLPTEDDWKKAINLLRLVDVQKDTVAGVWTLANGALESDRFNRGRIEIPYIPPEEYDVRMTFIRRNGDADVGLIMSKHGKGIMVAFGGTENTLGGIDHDGNPYGNSTAFKCSIENGKPYTCIVQVRNDGLKVHLDGNLVTSWKGDFQSVDMLRLFKLRDQRLMGVGAKSGVTSFQKMELIEVKGTGQKTR
jgi:hypothetical protein